MKYYDILFTDNSNGTLGKAQVWVEAQSSLQALTMVAQSLSTNRLKVSVDDLQVWGCREVNKEVCKKIIRYQE